MKANGHSTDATPMRAGNHNRWRVHISATRRHISSSKMALQRRPVTRLWNLVLFAASFLIVVKLSWSFEVSRTAIRRLNVAQKERALFASTSSDGLVYEEPLFRPPAEWQSLIIQVTIGCSWNKCTFCEMYQEKQFRAKSLQDVEQELKQVASTQRRVRDVFLADGDAMTLPTKHLLKLLDLIQQYFPTVRRVSSYCLPRNVKHKSVEDLTALRQAGLSLVYVGCESGSNKVLEAVNKGETYDSSLDALTKLQEAGIKRSIMILLGLGGIEFSQVHAVDSARLASESAPEFLSVLTTSFPRGMDRVQQGYSGTYQQLTPRQGLQELRLFLDHIDITTNRTVFRSDHASNYLILKGRLGQDKEKLLNQLDAVLDAPPEEDAMNLRPEWARGL